MKWLVWCGGERGGGGVEAAEGNKGQKENQSKAGVRESALTCVRRVMEGGGREREGKNEKDATN